MLEQIELSTRGRQAFHDITEQVQAAVRRSGVEEGICFLFCPHTTAALTLNENWDPSVQHDLGLGLNALAPVHDGYCHSEGNSPAHLKSSLVGASEWVPVSGGRVAGGRWLGGGGGGWGGAGEGRVLVRVLAG